MTLADRLSLLVSLVDGLSLRELSGLIGASKTYAALIAAGKRPRIGSTYAAGIARVFGTTTDFVVSGIGEPPTAEEAAAAVATARAARDADRGPAGGKAA